MLETKLVRSTIPSQHPANSSPLLPPTFYSFSLLPGIMYGTIISFAAVGSILCFELARGALRGLKSTEEDDSCL
jgi:hypothetical protein